VLVPLNFSWSVKVVVVAMTLALVALPGPSVARGGVRVQHCGRVGAAFALDVTAQGVSCAAARRFVSGISDHRVQLKEQGTAYGGYHCHPRQVGPAEWHIRCTRGQRVIRWLAGT